MKSPRILIFFFTTAAFFSCCKVRGQFICKPCNLACDTISFSEPGICPHCDMQIIAGNQKTADKIQFHQGAGNFLISDSRDSTKRIRIFYYLPRSFTVNSNILIVVPGAGRNGDEYRDAWTEMAERYSVLILSPSFNEIYYGFEDYHLGAVINKSNIMEHVFRVENTNEVRLDEENMEFTINEKADDWIFGQFDRIFDISVQASGSKQSAYDLFGHSAGGHILHRMALFHKSKKINRILASNASFYTLTSTDFSYPFGMKLSPLKTQDLNNAFENNLVIFLGEEDNETETGGTFLVSPSADIQGRHRLERGIYFYKEAVRTARDNGFEFNWKIEIIPGTGHDHQKMAEAAGTYLYE